MRNELEILNLDACKGPLRKDLLQLFRQNDMAYAPVVFYFNSSINVLAMPMFKMD